MTKKKRKNLKMRKVYEYNIIRQGGLIYETIGLVAQWLEHWSRLPEVAFRFLMQAIGFYAIFSGNVSFP